MISRNNTLININNQIVLGFKRAKDVGTIVRINEYTSDFDSLPITDTPCSMLVVDEDIILVGAENSTLFAI